MIKLYKLLLKVELATAFTLYGIGLYFRVKYQAHSSQLCFIAAAIGMALALINYATTDFVHRRLGRE